MPPELLQSGVTFPAVLLARGEQDEWYTAAKLADDEEALRARGVAAQTLVYPAGHEWTADVAAAAAAFVATTLSAR